MSGNDRQAFDRIIRELRAYDIHQEPSPQHGRLLWKAVCRHCGTGEEIHSSSLAPTEQVVNFFRNHHWEVSRRGSPIHQSCRAAERLEKIMTTTSRVGPDPKIARAIYSALDDQFDEKAGRFSRNASDQTIAEQIGCSVALVINIREEAYGRLAEDPAVTIVKDQIAALRADMDKTERVLIELVGTELAPFRARITKLEESLIRTGIVHHKAAG